MWDALVELKNGRWIEEMAAPCLNGSLIQFHVYKRSEFFRSNAMIVGYHSLWYHLALEQLTYKYIVVGWIRYGDPRCNCAGGMERH